MKQHWIVVSQKCHGVRVCLILEQKTGECLIQGRPEKSIIEISAGSRSFMTFSPCSKCVSRADESPRYKASNERIVRVVRTTVGGHVGLPRHLAKAVGEDVLSTCGFGQG